MALQKLVFKPGINRENTDYGSSGGWYFCDKMRFRSGQAEKLGGWQKYTASVFVGSCRALFNWVTLATQNLMAIGTNWKYYIEQGGTLNDVTPIRRTVTLAANPFATTNGSNVVVVTDGTHGAVDNDFVTFSGATGFNGLAASDLNKEFQLHLINGTTYSITVGVSANATSSGGGAAVSAAYQINVGLDTAVGGNGYGAGTYSRGTYGSGTTVTTVAQLRTWSQTNFGEDLVFNPKDAGIYYWDATGGLGARGVELASISGADNTPTVASCVLFTEDRHLVAFGCNQLGETTQDPMFVRWADQESLTEWTPTIQNTAGGYRLTAGNYITTARKMRQEVLVWTDASLYSMQFLGPPDTFGFTFLSQNISCAGPNCVATADDKAFWMGHDKFYMYDGRVNTLRCDLWHYIFDDINLAQLSQIYAGSNEGFNEIMWFYCSSSSMTIDRYVIYNYKDDLWYYGTMVRTAWLDAPLRTYPTAASTDGYLYLHEASIDDGSTNPPSGISAYIQSADFELGNGDSFMFVRRIIPDVTFQGSTATSPALTMAIEVRDFPGSTYREVGSSVTRTSTVPVEQFTEQAWIRLRGRAAALKVSSTDAGVQWQVGSPRLDMQPDGKR